MARCLSFSVSRDDSVTMTYGVRVRIEARNSCGLAFPGSDVAFEVRAYPLGGGGLAGRGQGFFQSNDPSAGLRRDSPPHPLRFRPRLPLRSPHRPRPVICQN
jgi:hypothetical protein